MKTTRIKGRRRVAASGAPLEEPVRGRIIAAAFSLFEEQGFGDTSMLDIATRAQLSKRDVYTHYANKHALLADCVAARTRAMRSPLAPDAAPESRAALAALLIALGESVLRNVSRSEVLMVYRLTIAESERAPELARMLDEHGRAANHKALTDLLARTQAAGLIGAGDPAALAARYFALLWGSLLVELLLRLRPPPARAEIEARARAATDAIMAPP
jgi:AcrR family transcriptional regulator